MNAAATARILSTGLMAGMTDIMGAGRGAGGAAGLGAPAAVGAALALGAAAGAAPRAGAAAAAGAAVAAAGPPGGSVGSLIVGAAEGLGDRKSVV